MPTETATITNNSSDVKSEVSREMELDELRQMHKDVQNAASDIEQTIGRNIAATNHELDAMWHGDKEAGYDAHSLLSTPTPDQLAVKAKNFRKRKLARNSAVPGWYKQQTGLRTRVISGAARVAKYRSGSKTSHSFY